MKAPDPLAGREEAENDDDDLDLLMTTEHYEY
jgi:hypothetical protein